MISAIREVEDASSNKKVPTSAELKNLPIARKSLVASKDIKEGEELSEFNIAIKRPGTGLSPYKYWELLGKKASKSYKLGDHIFE